MVSIGCGSLGYGTVWVMLQSGLWYSRLQQVTIVEKIRQPDPTFRKEREKMFINLFNTGYGGMNRQK